MATATLSFTCRLIPEAVEALRRQAAISGWSQAQLIKAFALGLQDSWLARFTAEERARYENKFMGRIEALEIRRRQSMKVADGADAHAGQQQSDGRSLSGAAAPANANAKAASENRRGG